MFLKAYAKINLFLDVLNGRKDGYHNIITVMHTVGLHDMIYMKPLPRFIKVDMAGVPAEFNLSYKAARLLRGGRRDLGAYIRIKKHIPIGSGMGGGSSDAARTLVGLNRLWHLNKTDEDLTRIASKLGSDVPFFIRGGMALAEGRGEVLTYLKPMHLSLIIVKPKASVSTKKIYRVLDDMDYNHGDVKKFLRSCPCLNTDEMVNVMEKAAFKIVPSLANIKKELYELGAVKAMMTGSGSAVFGIFNEQKVLMNAYEALQYKYSFVYYTKTI